MNPKELQIKHPDVAFEWSVLYKDGDTLDQNYGKGEENGEHHFGHIDLERLEYFLLLDKDHETIANVIPGKGEIVVGNLTFKVSFPKGEKESEFKLIYFRRVRQDFAPTGVKITVKHAVGLQKEIDGKNFQQIVLIGEDGELELLQQK